jgi:hypothetical protein
LVLQGWGDWYVLILDRDHITFRLVDTILEGIATLKMG